MEIIWLDDAKNDLISYKQNSSIITEEKIENYLNNLVEYVTSLTTYPYLGKLFFYHNGTEVRQLLYKMHRIIYYIENNEIRILAIIHTSQDIDSAIQYLNNFFW